MYLQNISTSLQIGQFYGDAAVKTSGTEQGFVQGFGTVCCRKDYNAFLPVKAVPNVRISYFLT